MHSILPTSCFHSHKRNKLSSFWSHAAKLNPNLSSAPPICFPPPPLPTRETLMPYVVIAQLLTYLAETKSALLEFRLSFLRRWLQSCPHLHNRSLLLFPSVQDITGKPGPVMQRQGCGDTLNVAFQS